MNKLAEDIKREVVQNEGDIIIEDLWNELEKHKDIPIPTNETYEKARQHYVEVKNKFDETQEQLQRLHDSIEAFEVRLEGLGIPRSETEKFRQDSNTIQVAFGKNAAFIQYTAASGVVFAEEVRKAAESKH